MAQREHGLKSSLSSSLPLERCVPAVCGSAFVIFPEVQLCAANSFLKTK